MWRAWRIYCRHWLGLGSVVLVVWAPIELLSAYLDANVFGDDNFLKFWRFSQMLENFIGIIGTAGVIYVGSESLAGRTVTFGGAIKAGFAAWGRLWWTRLLSGLLILGLLVFLILPGIFALVALSLVEPVTVLEGVSGGIAIRRSFALTRGRFWFLLRLCLCAYSPCLLILMVLGLPSVLLPVLNHWLIQALIATVGDLILAFVTLTLLVAYVRLSLEAGAGSRKV